MSEALHRIVYCSRNLLHGEPEQVQASLQQILRSARRHNEEAGITGALLYNSGCFAQILEGPLSAVEAAFERIQLDVRHTDLVVVENKPVAHRAFPNWSMAFSAAPGAEDNICITETFEATFSGLDLEKDTILQHMQRLVVEEGAWATIR
jgi:blue light- and temperature-responsive anti-repressor